MERYKASFPGRVTMIAAVFLLAACQATGGESATPTLPSTASPTVSEAASPSPDANVWRLVALGDSETTGSGDPTGRGWVEYYADLIRAGQGRDVSVTNLAENGTTSDDLAEAVRSNSQVRDAIATADIVVLGIGGADVNAGDDAFAAGSCESTACYDESIADYTTNIEAIAAEIMRIRGDEPTVLRAITQPNVLTGAEDVIPEFLRLVATEVGVYVARGFNQATCAGMAAHGGQCIDVLAAINGPDGDADGYAAGLLNHEDCCYPNEQGQRLMAELLYATGLEPIVSP